MIGLAFNLITPILLGAFFGTKLDEGKDFPLWTICLSVLGVIVGFWSVAKSFSK